MSARSIKEVISQLERIVEEASQKNSNFGIFAQLYLFVTREVEKGIFENRFEDGERMEKLDVLFANRYLQAFECYQNGEQLTRSWKAAFDAAKKNDLLVIQHLFMGMNAHINLDLGIAATETVSKNELQSLKNDFDGINAILVKSIEFVQQKLNHISPLLFLLDWVGKKSDEHLMEFSLRQARSQAWGAAVRLSKIDSPIAKKEQIDELDNYVAILNQFILEPGLFGGVIVKLIKRLEEKDPSKIIKQLA